MCHLCCHFLLGPWLKEEWRPLVQLRLARRWLLVFLRLMLRKKRGRRYAVDAWRHVLPLVLFARELRKVWVMLEGLRLLVLMMKWMLLRE